MDDKPKVALPQPCTYDLAYTRRCLPDYEKAIVDAGGEFVNIHPRMSLEEIVHQIASCSAVLLTSNHLDVNPAKYGARRELLTADPDKPREALDELLLTDAYQLRKPIFGICYGMQSLNVFCGGTLTQHVGDEHQEPHPLDMPNANSKLPIDPTENVNSKHRQAVKQVGQGLTKAEGLILIDGLDEIASYRKTTEAVVGKSPNHYVLGVQWHPERSLEDTGSLNIFKEFIKAACEYEKMRKKQKTQTLLH
jgi:putative glutamine amidotransferase